MTLEESVKILEKALREVAKNILEAFREFAGNILKLPPKWRYKALKCLGVDKDKIILFFNRENQIKIKRKNNEKIIKII